MDYFIGIDGGGTKTEFVAYDENGQQVGQTVLPTCHVFQTTDQQAIEILRSGVCSVLMSINDIEQVYITVGLAGYGKVQALRQQIEYRCAEAFGSYIYKIASDAEIGLAGALDGEEGIFIIAGTGSMALAYKDGEYTRYGGWGANLGDEASAYWIAKKLLAIFTKQADGRLPKSELYFMFKELFELEDDYELIRYIQTTLGNQREKIAQLAKNLGDLAEQKDPYALEICRETAQEISLLVNTLAKQYNDVVRVSYTGGVFKSLQYLSPYFTFDSNVEWIAPHHSPSYGAYLMAKRLKK